MTPSYGYPVRWDASWRSVFADAATDVAVAAGDVDGGDSAVCGGNCVVSVVFRAHCHHFRRHRRCR